GAGGRGEAAGQGVEPPLGAAGEERGQDAGVAVSQGGRLPPADARCEPERLPGQLELGARLQPVDEVRKGVEAADAEDLVQLRERVEVLRARRPGGERRARREPVDAKTR